MSTPDPFQTFRIEAQELIVELETALLELEERPDDQDLVDRAFRALHTLKGSGAMFGPPPLAAFAHHVETAFELIRKRERVATPARIGLFLRATDEIRRLLDSGESDPEREGVVIDGLAREMEAPARQAMAKPVDVEAGQAVEQGARWRIRFQLPEHALIYGTNPLSLIEELRALGPCQVQAETATIPPLDELEPTKCVTSFVVRVTTDRPRQDIEDVFIFVADESVLDIAREEDVARPAEASAAGAAPSLEEEPAPEMASQGHTREARQAQPPASSSVRVPAIRLDALMDQVGELVIAQARLTQLAYGRRDQGLTSIAEEIERLAGELRDSTMSMRMLPIGTLFGRFRRVVRDLSQELGKSVELDTSGEDTELDKTVIEALADPLVHLIRNSVDHGIEPATAREAAGKSPQGRIVLSARQAGAEVHVAITDDGRGLDRNRIREKAIERGLLSEGQSISDRELDLMIFQPGFSTAGSVTNVSGRGVGMDVVKRTIDELRGVIDVTSEQGKGATITLRLPLTLAIIDGLLVRVGRGIFVIPLSAVHECVELSVTESPGSDGRSFLNVRGELVPFVRLHALFGQRTASVEHEMVVIVGAEAGRVGLVVDQVIGHHQTVIKTLSPLHRQIGCLGGATILGDGTVALILDVPSLLQRAEGNAGLRMCA